MEYPTKYKSKFQLDDGTEIYVRPIKPTDIDHMAKLFKKFSPQTVYFRFFSALKSMPIDRLRSFCNIDYEHEMALVASIRDRTGETLLGVARYAVTPDRGGAEFAVVVADAWQNRKIGTNLFERLVDIAKDHGIETFHGLVMEENRRALGMIRNSGYKYKEVPGGHGVTRIDIELRSVRSRRKR